MSLFSNVMLPCAKCAMPIEFDAVDSVNADRRPDLRAAIVDGSFQRSECAACGASLRLAPEFVFLETGRGQWILVRPAERFAEWQSLERAATELFETAYGSSAPRLAQEIGRAMHVRVVFGWPALREKLTCAELELDDVAVELVKLALLRTQDALPLSDSTECRLVGTTSTELVFAWLNPATEETTETTIVPRGVYDGITADPGSWIAIREELTGGPMVDINRMLIPAA